MKGQGWASDSAALMAAVNKETRQEEKEHVRQCLNRDAPDIRPDKLAFFYSWYPARYRIRQPDIRLSKKPDIRPNMQLRKNI